MKHIKFIFSINFAFLLSFIITSSIQITTATKCKPSSPKIIENNDRLTLSSTWTLPNIYITNWSIGLIMKVVISLLKMSQLRD